MTVMVQTTTNYNAADEIVSVIVFRVPVQDKLTPTDAQRALAARIIADMGCNGCVPDPCKSLDGCGCYEAFLSALTAAAEIGPNQKDLAAYIQTIGRSIEDRTIERCAQVAEGFSERSKSTAWEWAAREIAAAIRALKEKP